MKINQLEIENTKRVKAVCLSPSANGLTVIGGKNGQGKTSILDAITWALGGDKYRPTDAQRNGSELPPKIKIELSNGLIVERTGKNSDLKVTDSKGMRGGQRLLDSFVEQFALDLPKFLQSSNKDKAATLLKIIGADEALSKIEAEEKEAFDQRRAAGIVADQKEKFANSLPYHDDAPSDVVNVNDLVSKQQSALETNAKNDDARRNLARSEVSLSEAKQRLADAQEAVKKAEAAYKEAEKAASTAVDIDVEPIKKQIAAVDENNAKVRANAEKDKAEKEAGEARRAHTLLDLKVGEIRDKKANLLSSAELPLPGLSVQDGELIYNDHKWDCMSSSDQLRIATAIVRKLNPDCEFVLIDKLEQMDVDTMNEFGSWLETEGLQAIATRVSTGQECTIVISDGCVESNENV